MTIRLSEIQVSKLSDVTTTPAVVDYERTDSFLAEDHVPVDGFTDPWLFPTETIFPTEMIRPTESLDDGGIIIIGGRPIESIHLFEVLI